MKIYTEEMKQQLENCSVDCNTRNIQYVIYTDTENDDIKIYDSNIEKELLIIMRNNDK